ncbi:Diaminobutyrate--2-oxoglutarate transaminase [Symmachiella macrocystis]|uniref:Diaminobutyrate--2-oxoglutarate transaminase n=1 Tax=Symmachiella macrocystis TaxID=2527985 RepID=A0A5C6BMQ1_9PLAN|nr:diaminobutyrate--2-oxoglutarate transaminase [Symmachiella macrocystis]TWU13430.1 Diaminobutyrate--2-oxoglutarate transaminase [Symmachiella macrocystis]
MSIFDRLESNVRGYCRSFPTTFTTAQNATLTDENGQDFIDFLAGAGTLNYGHNNSDIKGPLIEYLQNDGVLHGLDMHTDAKAQFLEAFEEHILWPLELDYKIQFTGPTGTNAVEAAFKLARKVTGRTNIVSFTNGFHGVSLGSVAATGNSHFRDAAGTPLNNVTFMPFDGYLGEDIDTLDYFERLLRDSSSGLDLPAAVVVETVQGEGGVNVASIEWLQKLEELCHEFEILLIVDDIQVGCGRTGTFFSFEEAGIVPDIVTLSKSLSAYGLPMSLVLMKSELDEWKPGEHNGTFRGNNLAFVSAKAAIDLYWQDYSMTRSVKRKGALIQKRLQEIAEEINDVELEVRGKGMIWGLACRECPQLMELVSAAAFKRGLIIETSGTDSHVLKCLPPLTIDDDQLISGLDTIAECFTVVLNDAEAMKSLGLTHAN